MKITDLHNFLATFFKSQQCELVENNDGLLTVQLTEEMDKALMNRPFYWHYIKSTGHKGQPMKLTFITNPNTTDENGEWIHFGSPRLQQIMQFLKQTCKYIKLFQKVTTHQRTALYPWLLINIKISYNGKQKKDEMFSIGLNLVNGVMEENMMELLNKLNLQKSISDYCYTISPLIKLTSGFTRIEKVLDHYISDQEHKWADEAIETLNEEITMIEHFYHKEDDQLQLKKEIKEITDRYTPTISYEVINGGIIYLMETTLKHLEH